MSPQEINVMLRNLFNGNGVDLKGFKIKADSPLDTKIISKNNTTTIVFEDNLPRVEIVKLFTIKCYIEQIVLGQEGGSIKIKNFPDINFGYDSNSLLDFLGKNISYNFGSMDNEIEKKYGNGDKQRIAKKCLQYAQEWSRISMSAGVNFADSDSCKRKALRKDCYDFVKENVEEDVKYKYKSVFITFILITVILPAIISWVVGKILDELFN
jgi:hypothetical protein